MESPLRPTSPNPTPPLEQLEGLIEKRREIEEAGFVPELWLRIARADSSTSARIVSRARRRRSVMRRAFAGFGWRPR
jgi:hypothetical protein